MANLRLKAALFAALLLVLTLSSCQKDVITVGADRKVFAAEGITGRTASSDSNHLTAKNKSAKTLLPASLSGTDNYSPAPVQSDKLADFAKSLLESKGSGIAFVNAKNTYERGETVKLSVIGKPNTVYTLKVRYKSGFSSAKGLGDAKSDERGYVIWTFKIGNASSEGFTPFFEVTGGGERATHSFKIAGQTDKETSAPAPETVFLAPLLPSKPETEPASETVKPAETITEVTSETEPQADTTDTNGDPANVKTPETKPVQPQQVTKAAGVEFINAKSEYRLGESVTLSIKGAPYTVYTLKVRYKSGYSKAKGLGDAQTDGSGIASWSFKISTNADITFEPWFEIVCSGVTIKKPFKLIDGNKSDETSSPADKTQETTAQPVKPAETIPHTKPADTPTVSAASLQFIGVRNSYSRGETVTITVKGKPNTVYILKVRYKSGYSSAQGLGEAQSNASGEVSWTFKIGSRADLDFKPTIEVSGGGETITHSFSVTE